MSIHNIILIGPPGSGKGTQAEKIKNVFGFMHISSGDIFREYINSNNKYSSLVKQYVESGNLCPDELTNKVVENKLQELKKNNIQKYLLDGYPRNINQAIELNNYEKPDIVILIDTSDEVIIDRILGRRICNQCKSVYNVKYLNNSNICMKCGGNLIKRKDDTEESIKHRIMIYKNEVTQLIDYYNNIGILYKVNGNCEANITFEEIKNIINNKYEN